MSVDLVAVGLITTDYVYLVGRLPAFGQSVRASQYVRACGGPAATAAACVSRLGYSARFVGRTGDDGEGDFVSRELAAHGVDIAALQRGQGRSRVATVLVDETTGERGFLSIPEEYRPLEAQDLDDRTFADARIVLIDDADSAGLQAARLAQQIGATIVFDGTWQSDCLEQFLPLVQHAVVGEFFARRWMPGSSDDDILRRLCDMGADTAVLTLGARGARGLTTGSGFVDCTAFELDVVDTTGAGDAFHGGYVAGLLEGLALPERMRFAAATAALNCRALGGQQALPTRVEVEQLLR